MDRGTSISALSDRDLNETIEELQKERARRKWEKRDPVNTTEAAGEGPRNMVAASDTPRFDLENLFTYHPPSLRQMGQYEAIRTAAKYFATVILRNTPGNADQTTAIRKLRECVMTANASIALEGR